MSNIKTHSHHVIIYTDGSCQGNPGPGGWAAVLICNGATKKIAGFQDHTTNNQMELQGAIEGLKSLTRNCSVELFTDSQYVKKGITEWIEGWIAKNWRNSANKPVKNQEFWEELYSLSKQHQISWNWVKGHSTDPLNNEADRLATLAASLQRPLTLDELN